MPSQNSALHFLYRQFFLHPTALPRSLSLSGQIAIVTGSNTGLGLSIAQQYLECGLSHLIVAVRSVEKGEAATTKLLLPFEHSEVKPIVEVWQLDMSSYASITTFIQRLKTSELAVNIAILNAGLSNFGFKVDETTGNEESLQVNWLGTALLTILLHPVMLTHASSDKPPVLSIVGSETAGWADFKELSIADKENKPILEISNQERYFVATDRYPMSKLLQFLFFVEFIERVGRGVVVNVSNPGLCYGTELGRAVPGVTGWIVERVKRVMGRSTAAGARVLAWAGIQGVDTHGKYVSDQRIFEFFPFVVSEKGKEVRKRVWAEMAGQLRGVEGFVEPL